MFEIGNTLREARLRRNLDISDCEAATKIRSKYLRALEEEMFDVLPGTTYVKGFLRTYAEFLELDGRLVLDEYESRFDTGDNAAPGELDAARRRARARRRGREGRVLAIAAGLVMIASIGIWVGFADDDPKTETRNEVTAVFSAAGRQPTYLEVRESGPDGRELFTPGSLPPGQTRNVTATPPIWIHVGDGSGLQLVVDGRRVTTPAGSTEFRLLAGGEIQTGPTP